MWPLVEIVKNILNIEAKQTSHSDCLEFCRKFCVTDDGSDIWWVVRLWCLPFIERFEKFLASFPYVCCLCLNSAFLFCTIAVL